MRAAAVGCELLPASQMVSVAPPVLLCPTDPWQRERLDSHNVGALRELCLFEC